MPDKTAAFTSMWGSVTNISSLLIFLCVVVSLHAQRQPEQRTGSTCTQLTGSPNCVACEKDSNRVWRCTAQTVWKEIPGSRMPGASISGAATGKSSSGVNSLGEEGIDLSRCDPDWSSRFAQISSSDSLVQSMINWNAAGSKKAYIDLYVQRVGGLDNFIKGVQESEASDETRILDYQRAGDIQNVATLQDLILFDKGMLEIGLCRKAGRSSATSLSADTSKPLSSKLLDPQAFANMGKNPIDQAVDDILNDKGNHTPGDNDCQAAISYVENDLVKQLDIASTQELVHKQGIANLQSVENELLDDNSWIKSTGREIASRIQYFCNAFQHGFEAMFPGAAEVDATKDALLKSLGVATKSIKAAYNNHESVKAAAVAAADVAQKELTEIGIEYAAKLSGMGRAYAAYQALRDYEERVKFLNDAAQFRQAVQEQVQNLDDQMNRLGNQVSVDAEKQMAINQIQQAVISTCVQPSIPIGNSPKR